MLRFLFGMLFCLGYCSTALLADDTPGEEAVKDTIKALKAKRAAVKDKADQALLDTVIKDLEERLAQVGKGDPDDPDKKVDPIMLPRNWELKFNTGKSRPTYNAKTGELKLAYDFSDPKQLKDFESADDTKATVQKGILTVKGGGELKHVVSFKTLTVTGTFVCGQIGRPIQTTEGYGIQIHTVGFAGVNHPMAVAIFAKEKEIASKNLGLGNIEDSVSIPLKKWYIGPTTMGIEIGQVDLSGKIEEGKAGQLRFVAGTAPNQYSKINITGIIDPKWAKEFFAK
jgi:hypothetical protein